MNKEILSDYIDACGVCTCKRRREEFGRRNYRFVCEERRCRTMNIKNKNELRRRIDLFLHDFTTEDYKINDEFCKETMRMMADFIGHVDNRLDSANAKIIAGKKRENELAEYILKEGHFCPIPVEVKCQYGFRENGCKKCLLKHTDLLDKPKEN